MKLLPSIAILLASTICTPLCGDLEVTVTERSADSCAGTEYITDYFRDGRPILTKRSSPDAAKNSSLSRSEAFYVWYSIPLEEPNQFRRIPAMMVFLYGDRRMKSATYNNGSFWGSAHFIDTDGDGADDILRLVENPGKDNGNKWQLIDAFTITKTGEVEPMSASELAKEIELHDKETNFSENGGQLTSD